MRLCRLLLMSASCLLAACAGAPRGPSGPAAAYRVLVVNEASDMVAQVAFVPGQGAQVERTTQLSYASGAITGAHGIAASRDGRYWYIALAHGTPRGSIRRYDAVGDTIIGTIDVGVAPTTLAVAPDGRHIFAVNAGEVGESGVSVVYAPALLEVARTMTCSSPRGGRLNAAGTHHYSVCEGEDELVELTTRGFSVARRWSLVPGAEQLIVGGAEPERGAARCGPTWAEPAQVNGRPFVYVACQRTSEILEVDARSGAVTRRVPLPGRPFQLAATPDGARLIITLRSDDMIVVLNTADGTEAGRIETSRSRAHGVTVSPDGRFAFVTSEGVRNERGALDVVDVAGAVRVAFVELGYQPRAVTYWLTTP